MYGVGILSALLTASLFMLLNPGCADKKYLQHSTDQEPSCNRYVESIFKHIPPEKRLYELAEYIVIYFSGHYKSSTNPAKKLAIRISCLDIIEDSAEIARVKRDFFKQYDPDLTTPENEAIDVIHKRADWIETEGHFFEDFRRPTNILGIHALMFGIPVQITKCKKSDIDGCESQESRTIFFPNGEARDIKGQGKDLSILANSNFGTNQILAELELFIPKNSKSIKDGVLLGVHLLPCPELSKVRRNYFDLEWNHCRLLADFFIDTTKLTTFDSAYSVQIITAIMQNDSLIKADTIELNGQLGNYLRYTPSWSLPANPENGDYYVSTVLLDKNSRRKFEQINKFDSELPFNIFTSSSRYMEYKKSVLDYFVPITSPTVDIKIDDYIVMPLVNIPAYPAPDSRQVIIKAYFNSDEPRRFTTGFSDDTVISYESSKRIRYEVFDTTGSGSRDRNLIAVDTVFISHPNYYLAHSLKTELRENGNLVMTYSVYDEKLENHRLLAAGYCRIP